MPDDIHRRDAMSETITGLADIHEKLLKLENGQARVDRWRADEGGTDISVVGKLEHDHVEYADDEHEDCFWVVKQDDDTYVVFKIIHVQELVETRGVGWVVVL